MADKSARRAELEKELAELEETKEVAEGKAEEAKAAGKPVEAKKQETIAHASEDSMAEVAELLRKLLARMGDPEEKKAIADEKPKNAFLEWMKR